MSVHIARSVSSHLTSSSSELSSVYTVRNIHISTDILWRSNFPYFNGTGSVGLYVCIRKSTAVVYVIHVCHVLLIFSRASHMREARLNQSGYRVSVCVWNFFSEQPHQPPARSDRGASIKYTARW